MIEAVLFGVFLLSLGALMVWLDTLPRDEEEED